MLRAAADRPRTGIDIVNGIDRPTFYQRYERGNCPILIRGGVDDWPARRLWSLEALVRKIGHRAIELEYNERGVFNFNANATTGPVICRTVPFAEAATAIGRTGEGAAGAYYIRETPIPEMLPELAEDIRPLDLIPRHARRYTPRIWIGGKGATSPIHYDGGDFNLLAHLHGHKNFLLFPPSQSGFMYSARTQRLPHLSEVDLHKPDYERHPLYRHAVPWRLILQPGDLLFVPSYWWHGAWSESVSISVNHWWRQPLQGLRDWLRGRGSR